MESLEGQVQNMELEEIVKQKVHKGCLIKIMANPQCQQWLIKVVIIKEFNLGTSVEGLRHKLTIIIILIPLSNTIIINSTQSIKVSSEI